MPHFLTNYLFGLYPATMPSSSATNVTELVKEFPTLAQGYLIPQFNEILGHANKMFAAKHGVEEFSRMKGSGTLPAALNSLRTPTLQVSSEFKGLPSSLNEEYQDIDSEVKKFRRSLLDKFINAKTEEMDYYMTTYFGEVNLNTRKDAVITRMVNGLISTTTANKEEDLPASIRADIKKTRDQFTSACLHVMEISRTRSLMTQNKGKKKRDVKTSTDVDMSGTDGAVNDTKSMEKMVAKVLKQQEQSRRDKNKAKKSKGTSLPWHDFSHRELTTLQTPSAKRQKEEEQIETSSPAKSRKRKRESFEVRQIKEVAAMSNDWHKRARLDRVSDYPDSFFRGSPESRVLFMRMKMPINVLRTLRLRNEIFQAPDVQLPLHIRHFLSVNGKFLFSQRTNLGLAHEMYDTLVEKVKTWSYFSKQQAVFQPTLPAYLAKALAKSRKVPDMYEPELDLALHGGRNLLIKCLERVTPTSSNRPEPEPILSGLFCTVKELNEELLLKQYMVFPTDKNLGLAVTSIEWYRKTIYDHLNCGAYQEVQSIPWAWCGKRLRRLASYCPDKNIARFIEEQVGSVMKKEFAVPEFHGLPKVHKNPWKIRPIVPMHSWVSTRLAMVIHYYLNPLLVHFPWISISSRTFTKDVLSHSKGKTHPRHLVTADVVGMYTNIRTDTLLELLRKFLRMIGWELDLIIFIENATRFVNDSVIFQFDNRWYWQENGIAMGAACSPILANIYMGVWEKLNRIPQKFEFYRRYIDDVFAIAPQYHGGEEIDEFWTRLTPPGLSLEWEVKNETPFLDSHVHFHGTSLCVRPYTKPLNRYQYIPFNSGHPLHVKKGLVKTELIRFASTSATQSHFDERKNILYETLRARGYPDRALKAWMKQVKWFHPSVTVRFGKRKESTGKEPLFVESEYNPLWKQIRLTAIWEAVIEGMITMSLEVHPSDQAILSLRRTDNMLDNLRRSNRVILGRIKDETVPDQRSSDGVDIVMSG